MRRDCVRRAVLAFLLALLLAFSTACSGGGGGGGGGSSSSGTTTDTSDTGGNTGTGTTPTDPGTGSTGGDTGGTETADTAAPSGTSVTFASSDINSTLTTVKVKATDNVGVSGYYVSESSTAPSPNASGWVAVNPPRANLNVTISFSVSAPNAPGTYAKTVYAWFKDAAGNVSSRTSSSSSLTVSDTVEPYNASLLINDGDANTAVSTVSLTLSAEDDAGVAAYAVSADIDPPPSGDPGWVEVNPPAATFARVVDFSLAGAGAPGSYERTVHGWFKDAAGNISAAASDSIALVIADTEPPSEAAVSYEPVTTSSTTINIDLAASDESGINGYYLAESAVEPAPDAPEWVAVAPTTAFSATVEFTIVGAAEPGTHDTAVYAWFRDTAGNVSAAGSCMVCLVVEDVTAPVAGALVIDNGTATTYDTVVNLTLGASDDVGVSAYLVSESPVTPSASGPGWVAVAEADDFSADVPFSLTPASTPGTYARTIYVWYKDAAGNVSDAATDDIELAVADTEAPAGASVVINNDDNETSSVDVSLSLSAEDDMGVAGWLASNTAATPAADDVRWNAVDPAEQLFSADVPFSLTAASGAGTFVRTVYVWFRDEAGNTTLAATDSIDLVVEDVTAPVSPALVIDAGAATTTSTDVTLSISAEDDLGVSGYYVSDNSATPAIDDAGWMSLGTEVPVYSDDVAAVIAGASSPGSHGRTMYAWFKDAAGNISARAQDSIDFVIPDTTAPTAGALVIDGDNATSSDSIVSVSLSATDDAAVTAYALSDSPSAPAPTDSAWVSVSAGPSFTGTVGYPVTVPATPGTYPVTVYAWFRDAAGNVSTYASDGISVIVFDTDAPQTNGISIDGGASDTSTTTVTVDLSATDNVGVAGWYLSEDNATPSAGDAGWTDISPAPASYSATVAFSISGAASPGTYGRSVYAWFKDAEGNVSATASDAIDLVVADTTAPAPGAVAIDGGASTTDTTSVTVDIGGTDDVGVSAYFLSESGTAPAPGNPGWVAVSPANPNYSATVNATLTGSMTPGTHTRTVYVWLKDAAGNVSGAVTDSIDLVVADTTEPASASIVINAGDNETATPSVSLAIAATDDVGVAGYYVGESSAEPLETAPGWVVIDPAPASYSATVGFTLTGAAAPGTYPRAVYVWFKDAAGNVSLAAVDAISLVVADEDAPSTPVAEINGGSATTTTADVSVALSATDNVGVAAYYLSESPVTPIATAAGWVAISPAPASYAATVSFSLTGSADPGIYGRTVYAWFKDVAGNVSVAAADSIDLEIADTTAPASPTALINTGDAETASTDVSVAIAATDDVGVTAYYISSGAATPAATDAGWTAVSASTNLSVTASFTLNGASAPGTYPRMVYVWFKDAAGNVSSAASDGIDFVIADTTAPVPGALSIDSGAATTAVTSVTLSLAAADDAGVSAYYLSESSVTPAASAPGWTAVAPAMTNYSATKSFTITGATSPGTYTRTVYAWYKDAAGNVSSAVTDSINLVVSDSTAPASPVVVIDGDAAETVTTGISVALSASDDVAVTAYFISESSTTPAASAAGWQTVSPSASLATTTGFTISGAAVPGTYTRTVYAWFKDAAGNVSAGASDSIDLVVADTTAPAPGALSINSGAATTGITNVNVSLSATDDAGVFAYYISESSATPTVGAAGWTAIGTAPATYSSTVSFTLTGAATPGTYSRTVYAWFKDAAGNISSAVTDGIDLVIADTTAPVSPSIVIDGGAASTNSTSVTLSVAATDDVGVTGYFVSESSATPAATDPGWVAVGDIPNYGADVPFSITGSATPGSFTRTVYAWYKDAAGNVSAGVSDMITLVVADTTAPAAVSASIDAGAASTTTTSVNVSLSATDDLGVTGYYLSESASTPTLAAAGWVSVGANPSYTGTAAFTLTGSTVPGTYTRTVYAWFKDAAGNISAATSDTIDLVISDGAAPTGSSVTIDGGAASTTVTIVTVSVAGSDDIGISGYYLSENTATPLATDVGWVDVTPSPSYAADAQFSISSSNKVGTYARTVYCWFKDAAGNVSAPVSDTIDFVISDATAPSVDSVVLEGGANSVVGYDVTVDFTVSDETGVVAYFISEDMTDPLASDAGWVSITPALSYTGSFVYTLDSASTANRRTVYIWAMDATGNVSRNGKDGINVK